FTDEFPMAEGFDENLAGFDLAYEDPDQIDVGRKFDCIVPALWLTAGACGDPANTSADGACFMPDDSPYGVLLDEDHFRDFMTHVAKRRSNLTHVWLVTDSEPAFVRMRERLPQDLSIGMLYRDYL